MAKIQLLAVRGIPVSRIVKMPIWKCPKCKTFNEDYMDECECGFTMKPKKKEKEEDRIEDFIFPDRGFSNEIY